MAVSEPAVQPLARLADKAEQRVPGDLASVGAARTLTRADRAMMLDQRRVEIERDHRPLEQRMDAPKQLLQGALELADVAKVEAAEEAAERRRIRHRVTAQLLLSRIAPQERRVVETLAARDQRLAQRQRLLRRRIAAVALLDRDLVQQRRYRQRLGQLAHEHKPGVGGDLLR